MLNCYSLIVNTKEGIREFLVSPLSLHSTTRPDFKAGKIEKLFFYENWLDAEYYANLKQELIDDKFKTNQYIINYGQDFEKFYLGCLGTDFEKKRCWKLDDSDRITEKDLRILSEALFNPFRETRNLTIFSPTRPSDIKLG